MYMFHPIIYHKNSSQCLHTRYSSLEAPFLLLCSQTSILSTSNNLSVGYVRYHQHNNIHLCVQIVNLSALELEERLDPTSLYR